MAVAGQHSVAFVAAIAVFVAWRLYKRTRRMVGRQRLSAGRSKLVVAIFSVLLLLALVATLSHPLGLAALAGGAALGAALGLYGARLTRFERTPYGLFYTPNTHLGIALSLLLVVRVGYRMLQLASADATTRSPPADYGSSPLTLFLFATLAGYYVAYALALLRWRKEALAGPAPGSGADVGA